jgi:hypothetical protein
MSGNSVPSFRAGVMLDDTKHLLVNYFKQAFEAAGLQWDSDNTAEIGTAVDQLFDAAVTQADLNRMLAQLP